MKTNLAHFAALGLFCPSPARGGRFLSRRASGRAGAVNDPLKLSSALGKVAPGTPIPDGEVFRA